MKFIAFRSIFKTLGALALAACALPALADIPATERAALDALYTTSNGAGWTNNTNWGPSSTVPVCISGSSVSSWYGITCDSTGSNVASIILSHNNLSGPLPDLSALTQLQIFDVDGNQLTGSIPNLSALTQLTIVFFDDNQLTGSIPNLSALTRLQTFQVENNQLTGSIPDLSALTQLQTFQVGNNQLTGSIPDLSALTQLQNFLVFFNQLTGAPPAAPASLITFENAVLCPNNLSLSTDATINAGWNTATGLSDWHAGCTSPPALSNENVPTAPAASGANYSVTSDQAATGYMQVIQNGTSCPAVGDASYANVGAMSAGTVYTGALGTLTAGSTYLFCFYAENAIGDSAIYSAPFTVQNSGSGGGAASVPTLGETALALLAALLGLSAVAARRRRTR